MRRLVNQILMRLGSKGRERLAYRMLVGALVTQERPRRY